uniref:Uncharacterized protein n=1 Tax=Arundo donax TaxID=35708 RepID=A0A0A9C9B1_ARUDO
MQEASPPVCMHFRHQFFLSQSLQCLLSYLCHVLGLSLGICISHMWNSDTLEICLRYSHP